MIRKLLPFLLPILLLTGCAVRTVYVPHGTPVRVWVKDADGQTVAGRMDLPEGWFCLPVDDADEPQGSK